MKRNNDQPPIRPKRNMSANERIMFLTLLEQWLATKRFNLNVKRAEKAQQQEQERTRSKSQDYVV